MKVAELAQVLKVQFQRIEDRFDSLEGRFMNLEDRFSNLQEQVFCIQDDFRSIDGMIDRKLDERFRPLYALLDAYSKQVETTDQETVMLGSQVARHDRWMHGLADKTGYKLKS